MKFATDVPANSVTVKFSDTENRTIFLDAIQPAMQKLLTLYGLKQKLSDSAASALRFSATTGRDIEEQRQKMVHEMLTRIIDGTAFDRTTVEGFGRTSYLAEAIAELYGITVEEATTKIATKTDEEKKALAANPKIAAKIAKMKADAAIKAAAKAAAAIDEEEMPEL